MRVGFTGTREGCSPAQMLALKRYVEELAGSHPDATFVHGSCRGADSEFHGICLGLNREVRPGVHTRKELGGLKTRVYPRRGNHARNRDIVDTADLLISCPRTNVEQEKGGTWYTTRYARKMGVRVVLITREGALLTQ